MNDIFNQTQFLSASNAVFIAQMYQKYLNSDSIPQDWVSFFSSMSTDDMMAFEIDFFGPEWKKRGVSVVENNTSINKSINDKEVLRNLYIKYGHISANLDPILCKRNPNSTGFPDSNFEKIYCGNVGIEIDHITNTIEREWLINEYEKIFFENMSEENHKTIAKELNEAEMFEQFIHIKFPGMKRFSLEGGESSIVAVHEVIRTSAALGINNIVIGMAHRGRLNMLTHVTEKPYQTIFSEFHKNIKPAAEVGEISWDVKYHAGFAVDKNIGDKKVNVQIAFNPSHLEAVDPVIMGMSYAFNKSGQNSMPIMIHGDAAIIGQGIVAECFNMSGIDKYNVGGVFHLVINNQIGFTAESKESRNSRYCTDIAKIIECPIFHINGNDPIMCSKIANLATKYRVKFKKDVVLDINCFRKYGHNEGDEPLYTNPVLYNAIHNMPSVVENYNKKIDPNYLSQIRDDILKKLDTAYEAAKSETFYIKPNLPKEWNNISYNYTHENVKTGIKSSNIISDLKKIYHIPQDFTANARLHKQVDAKIEKFDKSLQLDWACGEILAFDSLIQEGSSVRITGQDAKRGTFSHRHSILFDAKKGTEHSVLQNHGGASYEVANSPLSEYAVLGFEYGYSLIRPNDLTIWEAQFGDFSNGASTIIDQFISSAEKKWLQLSGLVMLLPHGFEGQGPEHSSARLERYLQLCAQDNMIVANCTTPANFFHILRRQIKAKYRKPLVIMSPKSLLRHKDVVSHISDFEGEFMPIIGDKNTDFKKVNKLIITSGKVYYDVVDKIIQDNITNIAVIRVEQYYPFASDILQFEIAKYKSLKSIVWVQEEPKNMGAWHFIRDYIIEVIDNLKLSTKLEYVGRSASASPATGFEKVHKIEQDELLQKAIS